MIIHTVMYLVNSQWLQAFTKLVTLLSFTKSLCASIGKRSFNYSQFLCAKWGCRIIHFPPECRKMHLRESNFKHFSWTLLEAQAFSPSVYGVPAYSTLRTLLLHNLMKSLHLSSMQEKKWHGSSNPFQCRVMC